MKIMVLAVVVAVMQATPPVPRQTPDTAAGRTNGVHEHTSTENKPSPTPAPVQHQEQTQPSQDAGEHLRRDNTPEPVVIREFPPVTVTTDWWYRWYVIFTGMVVAVGIAGSILAFSTLRKIERQTKANEGQLAEIKKAAEQADKTFALAELQAESARIAATATNDLVIAAKKAADAIVKGLEQSRERDRARIRIVVDPINPQFTAHNGVTCHLENGGFTRAFILNSVGKYLFSDSLDIDPGNQATRSLFYDEFLDPGQATKQMVLVPLEPDSQLTHAEVIQIRGEERFLHFYGFVRYTDIYEQTWKRSIHLRWVVRLGGVISGQITEWWEPVGPPEENAEIQEQKAN